MLARTDRAPGTEMTRELAALKRELRNVKSSNAGLHSQLETLQARLVQAETEAKQLEIEALAARESRSKGPPRVDPKLASKRDRARAELEKAGNVDWFDDRGLLEAGLSSYEIEQIQGRWERFEMAKLYLDDSARRDGYHGKPRYRQQVEELVTGLRTDLGPEGYDSYLYATGHPNRVIVQDILPNSPAELAGLNAGDVVIGYAGERVYSPGEFKTATTEGDPEDWVLVEVLRGEELMTFRLNRGPLGIRMQPISQPPYLDR